MTEPVSLAILKAHLRLDPDETGEDTYLSGLIVAARRACEREINRSVAGGSAALVLDQFPQALDYTLTREGRHRKLAIALPGGLVTAIGAITWRDSTGTVNTLGSDQYVSGLAEMPARIAPLTCWPLADGLPGAVNIAYTLAALDADDLAVVAQAMLLVIGNWYENRESVAVDVRGIPAEIPQSVTWLLQSVTSYGGR